MVLENDGSALSAAIMCAGMALSHAGIPTFDLVSSVTVAVQKGKVYLNPTLVEEQLCDVTVLDADGKYADHGIVVFSLLHNNEQVSQFYQTGSLSMDSLRDCLELCTDAAQKLVPVLQKCLVQYILRCVEQKLDAFVAYAATVEK